MNAHSHWSITLVLTLSLTAAACSASRVYGGTADAPTAPAVADGAAGDEADEVLPAFPWPPPQWSARARLSSDSFVVAGRSTQWGDVADRIEEAFLDCGYGDLAFYSAPGGFAIVSQFEQINGDGTPKAGDERWNHGIARAGRSFGDFFKSLFTAVTGHYRVVVFVVTDESISRRASEPTEEEAQAWLSSGLDSLPRSLRSQPFASTQSVLALIYEFERPDSDKPAKQTKPSGLSGEQHLERAQLQSRLGR